MTVEEDIMLKKERKQAPRRMVKKWKYYRRTKSELKVDGDEGK